MKINNADFVMGTDNPEATPEIELPEIAFAGRSNVGKSSLLNSIVHRKNLAKTSSTPGKIRQINFFTVENQWCFADLPGFGYAVVSKKERAKWLDLNYTYLENRKNLKLVCALIDSRHDPMETDLSFIEWLENHQRQFLVILTKCDKISKKLVSGRKEQLDNLVKNCFCCYEVLPYSSVKGTGRSELIGIIKKITSI